MLGNFLDKIMIHATIHYQSIPLQQDSYTRHNIVRSLCTVPKSNVICYLIPFQRLLYESSVFNVFHVIIQLSIERNLDYHCCAI